MNLNLFKIAFKRFAGARYAVSCSNGFRSTPTILNILLTKKQFSIFLSLIILSLFIQPIQLLAQDKKNDDKKSPLDDLNYEVIVVGKRSKKNEIKKKSSAAVREIYLEDYENRAKDLADVLKDVPGIHIKKQGGTGSYSTISLRGSSANQVTILIDGIPLNAAQTGVVNLGEIPLSGIERIEVYQSNIPIEFNTAAIGGVVNLVTKKTESKKSYLKLSGGSFETYSADLFGSYDNEYFDVLGLFSSQKTKGNFKFLDDNGTKINEDDDEIVKRRNNQSEEYNFTFKIGTDISKDVRIQLSNNFYKKNEGLPGIGSTQTENTDMRTKREMFNLTLDWKEFMTPILDFSASSFFSHQNQHFIDLDNEFGFGRSKTDDVTYYWGQNVLFKILPVEVIEITTSLGTQEECFKPWDDLSELSRDSVQKRQESYFSSSVELHLFAHRLILQGATRYHQFKNRFERVDRDFSTTRKEDDEILTENFYSPSQGILIKPFEFLTLKGNIGRYHRVPNYVELFGLKGTIIGNKDLSPEKSSNYDVGFFLDIKGSEFPDYLNLEYSFFENDVEDLIQFQMISSTMSKAFNTDSARILGHEMYLDFSIFKHIKFSGNYTIMNAVNTTPQKNLEGNKLPFRPEEEGTGRITTYYDKFEIFLEGEFMREVFLNPANNDKVPERTIYNAGFSVKPIKFIEIAFEVKNLTDNRVFDMRNYPLPGINYYLSVVLNYP